MLPEVGTQNGKLFRVSASGSDPMFKFFNSTERLLFAGWAVDLLVVIQHVIGRKISSVRSGYLAAPLDTRNRQDQILLPLQDLILIPHIESAMSIFKPGEKQG